MNAVIQRHSPHISLNDFSEDVDYALVGPTDSRIHEIRTSSYPFNTICHLGRDFGDGLMRGCSGVLIEPRKVLTAAHCLYSHRLKRAPVRIRVAPGRSGRDNFPYRTVQSNRYYIPKRFLRPRASSDRKDYDYGVIILPKRFSGINRYVPVRAYHNEALKKMTRNRLIGIAGYPGDRPRGTLWRHNERLTKINPRRLLYTVDTCPGHSGSPIWILHGKKGPREIIGVHTSGIVDRHGRSYGCSKGSILAPMSMLNSGVRITPEVRANIRNPARRVMGASPMLRIPLHG